MISLWKVERYRYLRNIAAWIGMVIIMCTVLFLSSDDTEVFLGDKSITGTVISTMKIANLLIIFLASVTIAVYLGREFKQKTICYERMNGYKMWKSSLIRTISCGMINACILQMGILGYIEIMGKNQHIYSLGRLVLLFLIISHICTCTTLYIMLFKDGAIGGCIAFVRFTLLSVFFMFVTEIVLPQSAHDMYMAFSVMSQWNVVIDTEYTVPVRYIAGTICSFFLEYGILLMMIHVTTKRADF